MAFSSNRFTNQIMALTVATIVICVIAIPIITTQAASITDATTKAIVQMLPIFMVLGVMMAAVGMFMSGKSKD